MKNEGLPAPANPSANTPTSEAAIERSPHSQPDVNPQPPHGKGGAGRRPVRVLNETDCLAGLSHLQGMLALGLVKPNVGNAMRGNYAELLRHYRQSTDSTTATPLQTADVLAAVRANPALLDLLEPFLSDEQIAYLAQDAADAEHGQA